MNKWLSISLAVSIVNPGGLIAAAKEDPILLASAGNMPMGYHAAERTIPSPALKAAPALPPVSKVKKSLPRQKHSKRIRAQKAKPAPSAQPAFKTASMIPVEVKQYTSGPWKGGKAVIHYSADGLKTIVRIFNRKGRQIKRMIYKRKPGAAGSSASVAAPVAANASTPVEPMSQPTTAQLAQAMPDLPELQAGHEALNGKEAQFAQSMQALAQIDQAKMPTQVGDPERNARPVYSEDEVRGARMGRYREFERRRISGRNPKSTVQGYDYYIDEVDRKEAKRTITYYRMNGEESEKVAIERFEDLTFFSNYDIKSSGKPNVKIY